MLGLIGRVLLVECCVNYRQRFSTAPVLACDVCHVNCTFNLMLSLLTVSFSDGLVHNYNGMSRTF